MELAEKERGALMARKRKFSNCGPVDPLAGYCQLVLELQSSANKIKTVTDIPGPYGNYQLENYGELQAGKYLVEYKVFWGNCIGGNIVTVLLEAVSAYARKPLLIGKRYTEGLLPASGIPDYSAIGAGASIGHAQMSGSCLLNLTKPASLLLTANRSGTAGGAAEPVLGYRYECLSVWKIGE